MSSLSDDDLDLAGLSDEELERAWDLWFSLAQTTNDDDPPFTHGVFVTLTQADLALGRGDPPAGRPGGGQSAPNTRS
jgi:hypothetical protein